MFHRRVQWLRNAVHMRYCGYNIIGYVTTPKLLAKISHMIELFGYFDILSGIMHL